MEIIIAAWATSGLNNLRSTLEKTHVWHHSVDLKNGQVKMQLVEREVHDTLAGGTAHSGGFAVAEWLFENKISF